MPLQATSGAASYDAFGGGVPVVPAYIEEVFSTYLYTGNGSVQSISNGINLGSTYGGSGYFGGGANASGLTAPASTSWQLTGDYTVEAWIYVVTLADGTIYATGGSGAADQFTYTASGELYFANQGTGTGVITAGSWIHVATSRSGTTQKIFVNGVVQSTTTVSGTIGQNATAYIGRRVDDTNYVTGYISNLRVVNGTAVYTSTFTPSTVPLTAITNTVLLTCQANGLVDASTNAFTITNSRAIATTNFGPFTSATAGNGGLVWTKIRSAAGSHILEDTVRGVGKDLNSNSTLSQQSNLFTLQSFTNNGYTVAQDSTTGAINANYVSWTFREQPKFFDVVTWTGNGTARSIAHNLNSEVGAIWVKCTTTAHSWQCYHRSVPNTTFMALNSTAAAVVDGNVWNNTTPTSSVFTLGTGATVNQDGETYVAYLFAHNAGGFGLTGTDNVISCGSYVGDGGTNNQITLGYEPQWILVKKRNSTSNWWMFDTMRGWTVSTVAGQTSRVFRADTTQAEADFYNAVAGAPFGNPTSTGFALTSSFTGTNEAGSTFIYIAIRRGPMKVPTSGTSVLNITTSVGTNPAYVSSFPVDFAYRRQITGTNDNYFHTRLQGAATLYPNYAVDEGSDSDVTWDYQNGMFTSTGANANQYGWLMRRAPSFMDVVCYTGTGSATTVTHNLGVVPELMIIKDRTASGSNWTVYSQPTGNNKVLSLNLVGASSVGGSFNDTTPTSSVFSIAGGYYVNASSNKYVAYLFATCAGVSKVGGYTGNGTTQTINCGFTSGARFVIIKRTDATGGWYVYDTARGMTVLTNPYVFLNSNAAEVATLGSVTTVSTGFALDSTILADINASGGSYIFLAVS
jgi:hypothetical protein